MALWWKMGDHLEGLLAAQKIEVHVGDHFAGQIALALDAQNAILQIHQAAAIQAQFPQAARAEEQIEVLHAVEGMPRARPCGSGFRAAAGRRTCRCR